MSKYKLPADAVAAWDALAAQYDKKIVDALSSFQLQRLDYCLKTKTLPLPSWGISSYLVDVDKTGWVSFNERSFKINQY